MFQRPLLRQLEQLLPLELQLHEQQLRNVQPPRSPQPQPDETQQQPDVTQQQAELQLVLPDKQLQVRINFCHNNRCYNVFRYHDNEINYTENNYTQTY